ncbi:hypothetical protein V8I69_003897 [Salmonella enterica]
MLSAAIDYFCHAYLTTHGLYLYPFSKSWDETLNRLLGEGMAFDVTEYTITIFTWTKTVDIWIGNRWYAYAAPYMIDGEYVPDELKSRPRFRTMRRVRALVKEHASK